MVFPASMCAMMPMLRVSSSLNARPIFPEQLSSPARFATLQSHPSPLINPNSAPLSRARSNLLSRRPSLPAIMREGLVGFGHAVNVFLLLHRAAARHWPRPATHRPACPPCVLPARVRAMQQQPANRQRLPAERIHFDRHLVVRAAHAPRLHFQHRLDVLDGLLENLERLVVGLLAPICSIAP